MDELRRTVTEEHEAVIRDTEWLAVRLVDRAMDQLERLVLEVVAVLFMAVFAVLLMMRLFLAPDARDAERHVSRADPAKAELRQRRPVHDSLIDERPQVIPEMPRLRNVDEALEDAEQPEVHVVETVPHVAWR